MNLASTGAGTSGLTDLPLTAQTINVSGSVFLVAQPSLPASVSLGNAHVGGSLSQAICIGNTNLAPGFQEGLNASVGTTSNATVVVGRSSTWRRGAAAARSVSG